MNYSGDFVDEESALGEEVALILDLSGCAVCPVFWGVEGVRHCGCCCVVWIGRRCGGVRFG